MSKLIVFEGPDGGGKSTAFLSACEYLKENRVEFTSIREPGGTLIGEGLRSVLLNPENENMCAMTELLLYVASRAQLVNEVIKPSLDEGKIVLCDRFYPSTFVYQSLTGNYDETELTQIINLGLGGHVKIDKLLIFDVSSETALKRMGSNLDRMEQKGIEFHSMVRNEYLNFYNENKVIINGEQSIEDVNEEVILILKKALL